MLNKGEEKKTIMQLVTAISKLRQKSISYLKVGEISNEGNDLVFYLDNREINRFHLPQLIRFNHPILYNSNGITKGGEIIVKFNRSYRIIIQEISGRIEVMR